MRKSSILKIIQNEAPKDREIKTFISPYSLNCTPYSKTEFSENVENYCLFEKKLFLDYLKMFKVIVLGDIAVGKTSIVNRFSQKIFDSNYKATIGVDFIVERFDILGIPFNLQVWDTAGQERFKCIAQCYYRGAQVIVIVFDLTDALSLSHTKEWLREALAACSSTSPYIFLVGTKKDLISKYAYKNIEYNAIRIAKKMKAEYWPVSAKTGENIDGLFSRIAVLLFEDSILNEIQRDSKQSPQIGAGGDNIISFKKNKKEIKPSRCNGMCQ